MCQNDSVADQRVCIKFNSTRKRSHIFITNNKLRFSALSLFQIHFLHAAMNTDKAKYEKVEKLMRSGGTLACDNAACAEILSPFLANLNI